MGGCPNQRRNYDLTSTGVLNALTRLVITNAVYFKAAWMNQFETGDTAQGSFTLADGSRRCP